MAIARAELARLEGEQAARDGDDVRARELFAVARHWLSLMPETVPRSGVSQQFMALVASGSGYLECATGHLTAARRCHAVALQAATTSHDAPVIALVLVGIADLAQRSGDARRAAMLLGAAERIRGIRFGDYPDGVRVERQARAALGESAFAESYQHGRAATGQAIADLAGPALGLPAGSWPPAHSPVAAGAAGHAGDQESAATPSA